MRIEQHFFSKKKAFEETIERQMKAESARKTEEEKAADREKRKTEIASILAEAEKEWHNHPRVLNEQKAERFEALAEQAVWLARECYMDVSVEWTDNFVGIIKFTADFVLLDEFSHPEARNVFASLMKASQEFSISAADGLFVIQLDFEAYDKN